MKLSMSMLAWYLGEYRPDRTIIDDEPIIYGMRFLPDEHLQLLPGYVYFGDARYFLSDPRYRNAYIIVHRQSYLLFHHCDYEELLNTLLAAFDFFMAWEGRLLEAASRQAPLQELVDLCSQVIENPMVVGGLSGELYIANEAAHQPVDPYWNFSVSHRQTHPQINNLPYYGTDNQLIKELSEHPQLVRNVYPESEPVLMMYLKQDQEPVATIAILQKFPEQTDKDLQLAPLLGRYLLKAAEFTSENALLQSSETILQKLLDGKEIDSRLLRKLEKEKTGNSWRLAAFRHKLRSDKIHKVTTLKSLKRHSSCCLATMHEGDIPAILKEQNCQPESLSRLIKELGLSGLLIGISMNASRLDTLPTCRKQACFALDRADGNAGIHYCESFAFSWLLKTLREQEMTSALLHPALELLFHYDHETHGELCHTLSVYLRKERNLLETAQALNIHRNTLKYRLRRIRELTGLTLKGENELAYLRLSDWLAGSTKGEKTETQ